MLVTYRRVSCAVFWGFCFLLFILLFAETSSRTGYDADADVTGANVFVAICILWPP
jgi:hypothetical protein